MSVADVAGVLLAGGAGRRMGREKALAPISGIPMGRRVLDALAPHARRLFISLRSDERSDLPLLLGHPGADIIPDDPETGAEGWGPLGGIAAALSRSGARIVLVAACDYPFLTPPAVGAMLAALEEHDAALPEIGGHLHPLCGAWSHRVLERLEGYLRGGGRKVTPFAASLDLRRLTEADFPGMNAMEIFSNLNTADELRGAEERLQAAEEEFLVLHALADTAGPPDAGPPALSVPAKGSGEPDESWEEGLEW